MKQKQIHRCKDEIRGCLGGGGAGGKDWKFGISRGKLLLIEWINKELYSISCDKP